MFLWTSTQWGDHAPVPFTDMLDVVKDTGFDGFRFVGWPEALEKYDLTLPFLDRELSKRRTPHRHAFIPRRSERSSETRGDRQGRARSLRVPEAFRRH